MKLPLNWIDILVIVILGIFVIRNAWIGFLRGLSSLVGLLAGYLAAGRLGPTIEKILAPWVKASWLNVASFALAFILAFLAVFIVAEIIARLLKDLNLSWIDHLLGAVLGFLKGLILLSIIFFVLATFYPRSEQLFRGSLTYPYIVAGTRFLVQILPSEWKSRFNYNLRHFFKGHEQEQTT